jgi:hypothetical protein
MADTSGPQTAHDVRRNSSLGASRERAARSALQGMVNHGVVICTGSGGKGHPLHYSMNPLIARNRVPTQREEPPPS